MVIRSHQRLQDRSSFYLFKTPTFSDQHIGLGVHCTIFFGKGGNNCFFYEYLEYYFIYPLQYREYKVCFFSFIMFLDCWNLTTCNIRNMPLTIPQSFIDFPVQLESYTWKLMAPEYISTEIVSKSVYLQQSVSDKPCNATAAGFAYDIFSATNKDQFKLGTFCPNGSIQKIQMRDNVTIILNVPRNGNPKKLLTHDLNVSFVSFIKGMVLILSIVKVLNNGNLHIKRLTLIIPEDLHTL